MLSHVPSVDDQNVFAAIAAASGAIIVKIVEKWIDKHHKNDSSSQEAERIREELRDELTRLRSETERLRIESDDWRKKFWDEYENKLECDIRIQQLEADRDELREQLVNKEKSKSGKTSHSPKNLPE